MAINETPFDEEALYDAFPDGAAHGYGPAQGFNVQKRLNDESLFTEEARADPVIRAFLDAPFSVTFAQFKSSTRESEWALHKPHRSMAGEVEGIEGRVDGFPADHPHIGTYLINHDRTMARWKWSTIMIEDGAQAGQMIYKQEDTSKEDPPLGNRA
ncbi:MAG: hypothetical protein ABIZ57_11980 [Candidatus Limnocylindria bacterium]